MVGPISDNIYTSGLCRHSVYFLQRPMVVVLRPNDIIFAYQNNVGPLTSGRDP